MAKKWIYKYNDDTIVVENASSVTLTVNNQIQDKLDGEMLQARLTGRLKSGEDIKVSLGGTFKMHCNLFIDHVLQDPVKAE